MDKKKFVILDGHTVNPGDISWAGLESLGELTVYDRTPADKIVERIGDAEIIFSNKTPIDAETIARTNIKYIGLFSTGYNIIDLAACRKKGVLVANVPQYSTAAVAQFTFALLFNLCHKVQMHSDMVHDMQWSNAEDFCFWRSPQLELYQKNFGIIGFGNIGAQVARIAFALDMKVLVYTRTPNKEIEDENLKFVDKETLFKNSDVLSVHCPLFDETKNLINKDTLGLMKPSAFVINTSRGGMVDEKDMSEALEHGTIAGFATDVVSAEPIVKSNPLLRAKNCVITPHIAWASKETRVRLLDRVVKNVAAFLEGSPQNIVKL